MGKIVASYQVRVTLRAPDDAPEDADISGPTIEALEAMIRDAIENNHRLPDVFAHVSAERLDI